MTGWRKSGLGIPTALRMAATGIAALAAACTEFRYEAGSLPGAGTQLASAAATYRPDASLLESRLKPGVSSKQEVVAVLGKPSGDGGIFLPIDRKPRETWSYYYERGNIRAEGGNVVADSGRTFLFVYFDGDRYDGYMWFSSLR